MQRCSVKYEFLQEYIFKFTKKLLPPLEKTVTHNYTKMLSSVETFLKKLYETNVLF